MTWSFVDFLCNKDLNMQQSLNYPRTALVLGALGLIGLAQATRAQTKEGAPAPAKIAISPAPTDVNDLSMEVAALRTLYLLRAGPRQLRGVKKHGEESAPELRKRQEPKVSANYRKVLIELRAAFIAGQEDRINELSEQLEELTTDEQPDLDDDIEITDQARKTSPFTLRWFDAEMVVHYLAAYGKDFPSPRQLLYDALRLDGKGKKLEPEQWKTLRAFVIREVSWQVGGFDRSKQKKIGADVAKLLDRAYPLSPPELKKQKTELLEEVARIKNQAGPTDVLKHVIEQDLAEMLSNPRLLPAVEARLKYLAKTGS
jgi:hypothetical protein